MSTEALVWFFLPLLVAIGSAFVAHRVTHAHMETAMEKERTYLAEARAEMEAHQSVAEERVKSAEESTRRATLEEVMRDIRIEERHFMRETNGPNGSRRTMVMQERVFFRNLPMSNWTERELVLAEGPALTALPAFDERPELLMAMGAAHAGSAQVARTPMVLPPVPNRAKAALGPSFASQ
jgi:hypothetical protein